MVIIEGKEYWDETEACSYLKIGKGRLQELYLLDGKKESKLKNKILITKFRNHHLLYDKNEIIEWNETKRKHIKYIPTYFNGEVKWISNFEVILDGTTYKSCEYLPNYFVCDNGNNKVYKYYSETQKFLDLVCGYDKQKHKCVIVKANRKSKSYFLHRLVLESFGYKKPFKKSVVRHLNDDPNDNRLINLKWGTQKENIFDFMQHHYVDKVLRLFIKQNYPEIYNEFVQTHKEVIVRDTKIGPLTIKLNEYNWAEDNPLKEIETHET